MHRDFARSAGTYQQNCHSPSFSELSWKFFGSLLVGYRFLQLTIDREESMEAEVQRLRHPKQAKKKRKDGKLKEVSL